MTMRPGSRATLAWIRRREWILDSARDGLQENNESRESAELAEPNRRRSLQNVRRPASPAHSPWYAQPCPMPRQRSDGKYVDRRGPRQLATRHARKLHAFRKRDQCGTRPARVRKDGGQ